MKYIITGGGTMGHIKPAMILTDELLKNNEVIYFGNKNGKEKKEAIKRERLDYYSLDVLGFDRKKIYRNFKVIYKFLISYIDCKKKLKQIKPDCVIGFGGYVSAPVLLAANRLKIKTMIHEQNSIPGLVNKYFYKRANTTMISFPYTKKYFENAFITGNPVTSVIKYKKTDILYGNKKRVLFIGGSLGAKKINTLALELKDKYDITLICGEKYYEQINKDGIHILKYYDNLISIMIESDLIISRSGATTISEILAIGKPVIFIPSPNVTNNHQEINANMLYDQGACEMILEIDATKENLEKKINKLLTNKFLCEEMITSQRQLNIFNPLGKIISCINETVIKK